MVVIFSKEHPLLLVRLAPTVCRTRQTLESSLAIEIMQKLKKNGAILPVFNRNNTKTQPQLSVFEEIWNISDSYFKISYKLDELKRFLWVLSILSVNSTLIIILTIGMLSLCKHYEIWKKNLKKFHKIIGNFMN